MTSCAPQGSALHGAGQRPHIPLMGTGPMLASVHPCSADLAQVKHQRVYLPQRTFPWSQLKRPTRKTDHAKFRSEP